MVLYLYGRTGRMVQRGMNKVRKEAERMFWKD
jgi:hypothetical protein